MNLDIRRGGSRHLSRGDGWVGLYCFSYDSYYNEANVSFGAMIACNEFVVQPGAGFGLHRHVGIEIVTTVLAGALTSDQGVVSTGETRVLDAVGGIEHEERNEGDEAVRFVQVFLLPGPRTRQFALAVAGPVRLGDVVLNTGDSVRSTETLSPLPPDKVLVWDC